ncbi:hypothetical protein BDQ17DRAFT_1420459 [Cyathus striatus]|nr:hypothetical protein BDQ17DRAFT_1420459 [Cyathus striatus]
MSMSTISSPMPIPSGVSTPPTSSPPPPPLSPQKKNQNQSSANRSSSQTVCTLLVQFKVYAGILVAHLAASNNVLHFPLPPEGTRSLMGPGLMSSPMQIALPSICIRTCACFQGQSDAAMSTYATTPCDAWGSLVNTSMANFGLTNAGEWSNAVTDCGLFLNGVGAGTRYEGTFPGMKRDIMNFALASMDALQDYFFWIWKIGNSSITGKVESPACGNWYMPEHRSLVTSPEARQTGGAGAGNIPASASSAASWPPVSISSGGAVSLLPSYTPTRAIPTLPAPTFTATVMASVDVGSGWANAQDIQGVFVPIPTCSYLDPWVDPASVPPSPLCTAVAWRGVRGVVGPPEVGITQALGAVLRGVEESGQGVFVQLEARITQVLGA